MLIIPLLLLIFMIGFSITAILKTKVVFVERLALSYLLGIGVSTFLVFLIDFVFNFDFSLINTFAILGASFIALFALGFKEIITILREINFGKVRISFNKKTIFWVFILSIFSYTLLVNSFWPITDWDALALYDFRAKVLLVNSNLITASLSQDYFIQYPLLTSLAHLFVYQVGLPNPKFIYSLFYVSFGMIFYSSLKERVGTNISMLFTIIFFLTPELLTHATMAYTNLPYTVYFCSGVIYLYSWIKKKDLSHLWLSSLLLGMSIWVRISEPFWMIPIFLVILYSLIGRKFKYPIVYVSPLLFFYSCWEIFMKYIKDRISIPSAPGFAYADIFKYLGIERLMLVLHYLYINVFSTWGLIFLIFIFMGVEMFITKHKETLFVIIVLFFLAALIMGTFFFSAIFPGWIEITDSARRMSMFLPPLMLYAVALGTKLR